MFCKISQLFIVLAGVSAVSFGMTSDCDEMELTSLLKSLQIQKDFMETDMSPRSSRAPTVVLGVHVHSQPINITDEVDGNMKGLKLNPDITSLYIDDEGSVKSDAPLLNAADQMQLASILKKSAVNELIFRDCDQFGFEAALQNVLTAKGIGVSWEEEELIPEEDDIDGER